MWTLRDVRPNQTERRYRPPSQGEPLNPAQFCPLIYPWPGTFCFSLCFFHSDFYHVRAITATSPVKRTHTCAQSQVGVIVLRNELYFENPEGWNPVTPPPFNKHKGASEGGGRKTLMECVTRVLSNELSSDFGSKYLWPLTWTVNGALRLTLPPPPHSLSQVNWCSQCAWCAWAFSFQNVFASGRKKEKSF